MPLRLGAPKQRALVAVLLLRANEIVPSTRLLDELWSDAAPRTARTALHGYVSALRKLLGADRLVTASNGYMLAVAPGERDLDRFTDLVAASEGADPTRARALLREALALWRGDALAGLGEGPFAEGERARLEELRLGALERRIDADLGCGKHAELVPELEALVRAHPLRERLRARFLLALYRSGRQAEALSGYAAARRELLGELGIEPGAELRELQRRILTQDPSLAPRGGARAGEASSSLDRVTADVRQAGGPSRRIVTVVFSDIVDSTELSARLDPEVWRGVQRRFFDAVSRALERHGGTVEKFIGDAVMAVFGVPRVREDDALRAVRAAVDMRESLAGLSRDVRTTFDAPLRIRTGLNTGEVIAGDPDSGGTLATGEAVVLARRLEQAAGPNDVLLGQATHELVRNAVVAEPTAALTLKGIGESLTAWRVLEVLPDTLGVSRRFDAPLVNRQRESALLRGALERAVSERSCQLVTLLGSAGIGKTRLALEFAFRVGAETRVLEGRCLDYGEGMTYWPIKELVRQAAGIADDDSRERARAKIAAQLPDEDGWKLVAERVAAAVGVSDAAAPPEETFWGVRRFLEALARDRPLVVILQDLHWAEPTLLDLVEYLANWSRSAPLLIVCLARPELLELRPSWTAGIPHAIRSSLEPLSDAESGQLMGHLLNEVPLAESAAARVTATAEGNPLFVEELLRMLVDDRLIELVNGDWRPVRDLGEIRMPGTIHALLAARLDRLEERERSVIQRAAIAGKVFWWGAVSELAAPGARAGVGAVLQSLVRKRLIEPERMSFAGEDAFRFSHILIREAAYAAMPKEVRADLHERFAAWLQSKAGERSSEFDELIGYHLEQTIRLRQELGTATDADRHIALRAGELLAAAGRRAFAREDMSAALGLLDRAVALLTDQHPARLELVRELSSALWAVGELARAETLLAGLIDAAAAGGDRRIEWYALLEQAGRRELRQRTDPRDLLATAQQAVRVFEELGDEVGLARAWRRISVAHQDTCRYAAGGEAAERGLRHARRANDRQEESRLVDRLCTSLLYGPSNVAVAVEQCEAILAGAGGNLLMEANVAIALSGLQAMRGAFSEARALYARSLAIYEELGLRLPAAGVTQISGEVELLAGDAEAAEREFRRGYAVLEPIGVAGYQAAMLAAALYLQGRYDESDRYLGTAEIGRMTREAEVLTAGLRGKLEAREGRVGEAEDSARRGVVLADETDALNLRANARLEVAETLRLSGRAEEMRPVIDEAVALFEAKGNAVGGARARRLWAGSLA